MAPSRPPVRAAAPLTALLLVLSACPGGVAVSPDAHVREVGVDSLRHEIRAEPIPMGGTLAFDAARLPPGARGKLSSFDGDNFAVNIPPTTAGALSPAQVFDQTVAPLLQAMGYGDRLGEITLPDARPQGDRLPTADLSGLARETCHEVQGDQYQRFHAVCQAMVEGRSNPVAERVFQLAYGMSFAQFKADVERPRIQYVYMQRVDGVPIEHVGVVAVRWEGESVTSVHGTVLNRYGITNTLRLSDVAARERGQEQVQRLPGISRRPAQFDRQLDQKGAELVLLPYGTGGNDADGSPIIGLRYAWRTLLFAYPARGPQRPGYLLSWMAWIDADDGRLLELAPQFDNVSGAGRSWRRDPNTPTQGRSFQVDGASGGQYVLSRSGVFNRLDRQGDGAFDDGEVSISSTTGGSSALFANFNQAPLNDAAGAVCAGGSNPGFREVNAFAHLHSFRQTLVSAGTFPTFPQAPVTVWIDTPDLGGNRADYDAFGTGQALLLFIPGSTFYGSTCPDLSGGVLPGSTDPTTMTHEFTHLSTKRLQERRPADWCGLTTCSLPVPMARTLFHDFADAWAHAYASTPCQAGWSRKNTGGVDAGENCATHDEGDYIPRLASVGEPFSTASVQDHFPEKRGTLRGDYEDGQIVAAALWLTRQGMRSRCLPSGTAQYWVRLNRGLYDYGFVSNTCGGSCDRDVYRFGQNLLQQLAQQWATAGQPGGPPAFHHNGAHTTNKVLSGWARAGIFLTPSTCIDGDATTGDPLACPVSGGGEMGGDAIVDVFDNDAGDDNVIDQITHPEFDYARRGGGPPTFRVWTGPRYRFDVSGMASSFTPSMSTPSPCHAQYVVELSASASFASIVSSGWRSVSRTSQPECYDTWTPPASSWAALGGSSGDVRVYYRVRTRDAAGMNERISTEPANGTWTVPAPYVIVNSAGQP